MISSERYILDISDKKINFNDICPSIILNKNGAIVSFVGTIKDVRMKKLDKIYYSVFLDLAYSLLLRKLKYLTSRYDCNIYLRQYYGFLNIGDINIVIVVSSEKRKLSFDICSLLLEYVKTNIPIWKKEFYLDKSFKWINSF